jgi:carotenoid 1,2-hydratase
VFSPYYAWRGRRDALDHCAVNVALYGEGGNRWAMTERGRGAVERSATLFRVGPSGLAWDGSSLTITLDEVTAPIPRRVRGTVTVHATILNTRGFALEPSGRHTWWPIAPAGRLEFDLASPGLRWSGNGYVDSNQGSEPLEAGFEQWDWCRAPLKDGAAVLYDVTSRHGPVAPLALHFDSAGGCHQLEPPSATTLPRTGWRVSRHTRVDAGQVARVRHTLEDTPFYSRSLIDTHLAGEQVTAVHESLSLNRFASPIVKAMLPFRMPRRRGPASPR